MAITLPKGSPSGLEGTECSAILIADSNRRLFRVHGAMVAQLTVNQEVVGSSPTAPANPQLRKTHSNLIYFAVNEEVRVRVPSGTWSLWFNR